MTVFLLTHLSVVFQKFLWFLVTLVPMSVVLAVECGVCQLARPLLPDTGTAWSRELVDQYDGRNIGWSTHVTGRGQLQQPLPRLYGTTQREKTDFLIFLASRLSGSFQPGDNHAQESQKECWISKTNGGFSIYNFPVYHTDLS